MPAIVDDELDQTIDPAVNNPAAAPGDEPVSTIGETDIGVVVTPGRGDEPDAVSGYFVTLDDQGRIVNDTGIPTARLLAAALSSDQPIYVKRNGRVYRGRLESGGQSIVMLDPIVPSGDLTRSLHLPANEQHRLMDRHLETAETVEHLVAPSAADSTPPVDRKPSPFPAPSPPFGQPVVPPARPTSTTPSTPVQPSGEGSSVSPVTPSVSPTVAIPSAEIIPLEINDGPAAAQAPNIKATVPNVEVSADTVGSAPATTPLVSGSQEIVPPSPNTPPANLPIAPASPLSGRAQSGTAQPKPSGATPTESVRSDRSKPTFPTSQPVGSPPAPSSPPYGRRPRRATSRSSGSAPATTTADQPPSPAFAQGGIHPPTSPGRVEPITGGSKPVSASSLGSPVDQIDQPAQTPSTPPHPDHQAVRPTVGTPDVASERTPAASSQSAEPPVPAFMAGGPSPVALANEPGPGQIGRSSSTTTLMPAVGPESGEQVDQPRRTPPPPRPRQISADGGGPLVGVDDQATAGYKPLTAPAATQPSEYMTESPEAAAGEQAEATGPETQATQQLRAEKIEAQRRAQFESNDRVRQWKAIQQGKQAKEIPVVGEFAEETAKKVYKRGWQIAQEVVEDMALSLSDFFLFTGPAVVGLYLIRWIGGNMMGGLFVKEVTLPALLGQGQGEQTFNVQLIPGYSIDDPIDYVRHIKFLVVGAITVIIYGIIFLILYLALNPTEAAKLGLKALTAGLSAVNPIVNLFLSK